jgi:hypothetical protein
MDVTFSASRDGCVRFTVNTTQLNKSPDTASGLKLIDPAK